MLVANHKNGNVRVKIDSNGTRTLSYDDVPHLDFPLNVDVRLGARCSFGYNKKTKKAICDFCHESATADGVQGDLNELFDVISQLPSGTEIAIGVNEFTEDTVPFLERLKNRGYICNITVNQGHVFSFSNQLRYLIDNQIIYGIGISYRAGFKHIPKWLVDYEHMVVHVIAGIDDINEVEQLNCRKLLILGEKDFGFNQGKVDLTTKSHREWYRLLLKLVNKFDVVSFDNLALQQLNVRRYLTSEDWDSFHQHENSFYIDATRKVFAPNSRSNEYVDWNNTSIKEYFATIQSWAA